jgi:glucan-binding YG repeat protein
MRNSKKRLLIVLASAVLLPTTLGSTGVLGINGGLSDKGLYVSAAELDADEVAVEADVQASVAELDADEVAGEADAQVASSTKSSKVTKWVKENDKYYYYKDGKLVKNKLLTISQKVDGKTVKHTYYFTNDGSTYTGLKRVLGKLYYFGSENKGAAVSGWIKLDDRKYYFSKKNFVAVSGLVNIAGKKYYFNPENNVLKSGFITVNGSKLYFTPKTGVQAFSKIVKVGSRYYFIDASGHVAKNKIVTSAGKSYYATASGVIKTGYFTYNGNRYYSSKKGVIQTNYLKKINGKTFYFGTNGKSVTGLRKVGSYYYYFGKNGVMKKSGWVKLKSGRYYFGKNGRAYTGFHRVDGNMYYFSAKGVMQKNTWRTGNGHTYYFGATGKALTGLNKIKSYYYYFGTSGIAVKNRFVTISGKKYYFGYNGRAYTGVHKFKKYKYYFNFSSTGYLTSGTVTIKGTQYKFNENGRPYTGWFTAESGNKYYYKANGVAAKGSASIDGKLYLFGENGVQITTAGWNTVNKKTYYLNDDGTLVTGYKKIDSDYYYFGKKGVRYEKKWAYVGDYKFYFNSEGKRLTDVSSIIGTQDSYNITINKTTNVVTVYAKDGDNGYIIPVKAFICSTGNATPLGTYYTPAKWRWLTLMGPCYGQWDTQITGDILFHSVYYSQVDANTLSVSAYNQLGTTCSHGCVRLTARDAKWIYDNCPIGTKVTIFAEDAEGPFPKPSAYTLSSSHTWDPTDPNMAYKCKQNGCH